MPVKKYPKKFIDCNNNCEKISIIKRYINFNNSHQQYTEDEEGQKLKCEHIIKLITIISKSNIVLLYFLIILTNLCVRKKTIYYR